MVDAMSGSSAEREPRLVDRATRGDVSAFETLYRGSVGKVFALCLRMCGERSLAEELTQEAFVRAWQKLPSFRGESAFSTWMHRLTVNVVLGHFRSTGRRQHRELAAGEAWFAEGTATAEHPGTSVDLERAIAALPDGARTVFVLHDVEGYKHTEIADATGIAVGTSKAQLSRARQLLRKALAS
jgi:RNA polymerase sigma-70 factor (ECF subfamily)